MALRDQWSQVLAVPAWWFLGRWTRIPALGDLGLPLPAWHQLRAQPPLTAASGSGASWKSQGKISVAASIQATWQEIINVTVRQKFSGCRIYLFFIKSRLWPFLVASELLVPC